MISRHFRDIGPLFLDLMLSYKILIMKIRNIILICPALSLMVACNKFLDVKPKGVVIPESVLDYDKMMNGVTSNLVCSYLVYLDPDNGVPDPIAVSTGTASYRAYGWEAFISTPSDQDNDWNRLYKSIYIANEVIEKIRHALGGDDKLRSEVEADAFAERAACYFFLVNAYAKHYNPQTAAEDLGVPLLLKNDLEQEKPRATVKEVYEQIKNDLETSLSSVRTGIPATKVRASKAGVYGLLARLYLYQGEFEKSQLYADSCLNIHNELIDYNAPLKPGVPTPTEFDNNPEIVWYKDTYNFNYFVRFYYSDELSAIYDRQIDLRWVYYAKDHTETGEPILQGPYERPRATVNDRGMLVNTPEILLIRAESKIRTGDVPGGIEDMNLLRMKRFVTGTPLLNASDYGQTTALKEVINERRRELAFYGYNWFDLKRYNIQGPSIPEFHRIYRGQEITLSTESPRYVLAIPPNVMLLNDKLIQNDR